MNSRKHCAPLLAVMVVIVASNFAVIPSADATPVEPGAHGSDPEHTKLSEKESEIADLTEFAESLPKDGIEERLGALYRGNSVKELLDVCKDLNEAEDMIYINVNVTLCRRNKTCVSPCTKQRVERLRDAQTRVRDLIDSMHSPLKITWNLAIFLVTLALGAYLIFVKQFNWRTLPFFGYEFEEDPTDGYRYGHYMWMRWVILDSEHPMYYRAMAPDTFEIEYIPQSQAFEEDDDLETIAHPAWSVEDIYNVSTDPHEQLDLYFRRIQYQYEVSNIVTPNIKKFKGKMGAG